MADPMMAAMLQILEQQRQLIEHLVKPAPKAPVYEPNMALAVAMMAKMMRNQDDVPQISPQIPSKSRKNYSDFTICCDQDCSAVIREVTEYLQEGWELHGDMIISNEADFYFIQALIFPEEEEKEKEECID